MRLPDSDVASIPTMLFGTATGSIGMVASLNKEDFDFFKKLEVQFDHGDHRVDGTRASPPAHPLCTSPEHPSPHHTHSRCYAQSFMVLAASVMKRGACSRLTWANGHAATLWMAT